MIGLKPLTKHSTAITIRINPIEPHQYFDLFEKCQPDLNKVPEDIIYYLLNDLLQEHDSVQIDELLTMKGGPGKIMNLKRTMLIELLERLENQDKIIINHTAGLNMVYLNEKTDGNSVVRNYYEKHGVHYEPFDKTDTN